MVRDVTSELAIALQNARLPFRLCGALLFGSTARRNTTADSDIDLLVVAEGINPKLHRRGEEIFLIKKSLPLLTLDILLFTPEETRNNFENHNPLFLDIAEDGVILLDHENFLKGLVDGTLDYVRQNGISRLSDGWQFPVKERSATFLSQVR